MPQSVRPQYLRMYQSAVDPSDVEELGRLWAGEVAPVLAGCPGCLAAEMTVGLEASAGGLVDTAAVSRWASLEEMSAALASSELRNALVAVCSLLRQEPVSKTLQVLQ